MRGADFRATLSIMRNASPARPATANFEPFGEPVAREVAQVCTTAAGDRMARRIGGAVFWTLALLIMAGRIYAFGLPEVQAVAAKAVQATAAIVALR